MSRFAFNFIFGFVFTIRSGGSFASDAAAGISGSRGGRVNHCFLGTLGRWFSIVFGLATAFLCRGIYGGEFAALLKAIVVRAPCSAGLSSRFSQSCLRRRGTSIGAKELLLDGTPHRSSGCGILEISFVG